VFYDPICFLCVLIFDISCYWLPGRGCNVAIVSGTSEQQVHKFPRPVHSLAVSDSYCIKYFHFLISWGAQLASLWAAGMMSLGFKYVRNEIVSWKDHFRLSNISGLFQVWVLTEYVNNGLDLRLPSGMEKKRPTSSAENRKRRSIGCSHEDSSKDLQYGEEGRCISSREIVWLGNIRRNTSWIGSDQRQSMWNALTKPCSPKRRKSTALKTFSWTTGYETYEATYDSEQEIGYSLITDCVLESISLHFLVT
jgi:hypothetical protein